MPFSGALLIAFIFAYAFLTNWIIGPNNSDYSTIDGAMVKLMEECCHHSRMWISMSWKTAMTTSWHSCTSTQMFWLSIMSLRIYSWVFAMMRSLKSRARCYNLKATQEKELIGKSFWDWRIWWWSQVQCSSQKKLKLTSKCWNRSTLEKYSRNSVRLSTTQPPNDVWNMFLASAFMWKTLFIWKDAILQFWFHFIYEFFSEGFSYEVVKFHINLREVSMHYLIHFLERKT